MLQNTVSPTTQFNNTIHSQATNLQKRKDTATFYKSSVRRHTSRTILSRILGTLHITGGNISSYLSDEKQTMYRRAHSCHQAESSGTVDFGPLLHSHKEVGLCDHRRERWRIGRVLCFIKTMRGQCIFNYWTKVVGAYLGCATPLIAFTRHCTLRFVFRS
jgi:hypothetical protein